MSEQSFQVRNLGRMAYEPCVELQKQVLEAVSEGAPDTLLLVEHDPILTLGANFHEENLLLGVAEYESRGIQIVRTDRGGDVTYHGPGQLVIYPIFNVANRGKDLHKWLRDLEEAMLLTAISYGLKPRRFAPHTGVWIEDKKLAAIGVKIKRWVNMHGIALNCENDLDTFDLIVPCGIRGYGVTTLTEELGQRTPVDDAKPRVVDAFRQVFPTSGSLPTAPSFPPV